MRTTTDNQKNDFLHISGIARSEVMKAFSVALARFEAVSRAVRFNLGTVDDYWI